MIADEIENFILLTYLFTYMLQSNHELYLVFPQYSIFIWKYENNNIH